jgi:hypothetical protein
MSILRQPINDIDFKIYIYMPCGTHLQVCHVILTLRIIYIFHFFNFDILTDNKYGFQIISQNKS